MLIELMLVGLFLFALTEIERNHPRFVPNDLADMIRIHVIYGLLVFWLARWRPWTIWITGAFYLAGMLFLLLISAALFMPFPIVVFAFAGIIYAAYRLGKSQHRKRAT